MKGPITKKLIRRRNRRFYAIYFGCVAAVLIFYAFGARYLAGELKEFEDTRNIYTAQKVLTMIQNGEFEALYEYEDKYPGDTAGQYAQALRELSAGGEFTLEAMADSGRYRVWLNGQKFAEFALRVVEGASSPRGYSLWELGSVRALALTETAYRVRAREDYKVYADGLALAEADRVQSGIETDAAQYLPEGVDAPAECVYEVRRRFGVPEFTAEDGKGRPSEVTLGEDGTYTCAAVYEELDEETLAYVGKCAKCLALYTADDKDFNEMNKYLLKDSDAYKALRALETGWFTLHTAYRFENTSVTNCQFYGDTVLACDVNLNFIITVKQTGNEKTYPLSYTFYFQLKDGDWLLYNMAGR